MAAVVISVDDIQALTPSANSAVIQRLLTGTLARAKRLAPCLAKDDLDDDVAAAARDILIDIIMRAIEIRTGETTNLIAGPYQQGITSDPRGKERFRPNEIRELQELCGMKRGGAFSIALTYDGDDAFTEDVTESA